MGVEYEIKQIMTARPDQWVRWGEDEFIQLDAVAFFALVHWLDNDETVVLPVPATGVWAAADWPPYLPNHELIMACTADEAIQMAEPADMLPCHHCGAEWEIRKRSADEHATRAWRRQHEKTCILQQ